MCDSKDGDINLFNGEEDMTLKKALIRMANDHGWDVIVADGAQNWTLDRLWDDLHGSSDGRDLLDASGYYYDGGCIKLDGQAETYLSIVEE